MERGAASIAVSPCVRLVEFVIFIYLSVNPRQEPLSFAYIPGRRHPLGHIESGASPEDLP